MKRGDNRLSEGRERPGEGKGRDDREAKKRGEEALKTKNKLSREIDRINYKREKGKRRQGNHSTQKRTRWEGRGMNRLIKSEESRVMISLARHSIVRSHSGP